MLGLDLLTEDLKLPTWAIRPHAKKMWRHELIHMDIFNDLCFFLCGALIVYTKLCVDHIYIYTWNLVGCKISVLIRNDKNLFHVRGEMSLSSEIVISLWPQVRPLPSLWLIVFQRAIRTPQIFANILTCTGIPGA